MLTPKETHETFFFAHTACKMLEKIAEERKNGDNRPFHLRVDFWSPHQPYWAHPDYLKLYKAEDIPEHPSFNSDLSNKPNIYKFDLNYPMAEDKILKYPNPVPWSIYADTLRYNYAQQTMTDEAAGIILKKLEELGLDDNTIILWTTDHGDAIGCHGGHFDKEAYMPEEMIRVPLAIKFPGVIPSGQVSNKLVSNIDVAPTILDAAGTHFDERIDGESIIPIAIDPETPWRKDIMIQTYGNLVTHHGRCIVTDRYKYVYNWDDMDELYDLQQDPSELNNLINNLNYTTVIEDMKARLRNWREKTGDNVERKWIRGKKLKPPKPK
jgi:arylsulfatase A-like enzyme